jgi:hypothetical protein
MGTHFSSRVVKGVLNGSRGFILGSFSDFGLHWSWLELHIPDFCAIMPAEKLV